MTTATSTPTRRARWPKSCGCGEVWSRDHWPELPLVGRYLAGRDGWIELRSCFCGSTLVVDAGDLEPKPDGVAACPLDAQNDAR